MKAELKLTPNFKSVGHTELASRRKVVGNSFAENVLKLLFQEQI